MSSNTLLRSLAVLTLLPVLAPAANTPALTATPAAITVSYVLGSALPATQTVAIKAAVGTPTLVITTPAQGADWLVVTSSAAKAPASLTIRVNPTGLAEATYVAPIQVSTADSSNTAVTINVTLIITSPPPALSLSSTALNFVSPPASPAAQMVTLSSSGGNISYTAAVQGATWLSITPNTGIILPGLKSTLTVTVDPTGLVPQTNAYTGKIVITANNVTSATKTQTINVSLIVNAQTPTLTSIWPTIVAVNSPSVTITVRGTQFVPASVVKLNSVPQVSLTTTYLSPNVLQAVIPSTSLTLAGQLDVLVNNPAPGGDSTTAPFTVTANPFIQAITDAGSFVAGTVSPGELVAIFGPNIGPTTPAYLSDTNQDYMADTTIGTLTVTVDGKPAPILLAMQNQITIAVPFSATTGQGKIVTITNGAATPIQATVNINATNPGIFTMDGSGRGQAAALNIATTGAYSLNSSASPAKKGDTVVLYVTGQGINYSQPAQGQNPATAYDVTIPDLAGYLNPIMQSPPVPSLVLTTLPTVTIGGAQAAVSYAGPAPASIMGLVQINAVIPAQATTGNAVPLVVNMGGVDSQAGVTLAVK